MIVQKTANLDIVSWCASVLRLTCVCPNQLITENMQKVMREVCGGMGECVVWKKLPKHSEQWKARFSVSIYSKRTNSAECDLSVSKVMTTTNPEVNTPTANVQIDDSLLNFASFFQINSQNTRWIFWN